MSHTVLSNHFFQDVFPVIQVMTILLLAILDELLLKGDSCVVRVDSVAAKS